MATNRHRGGLRGLRFWLIERIALPMAMIPLRLLVRSWRLVQPAEADEIAAVTAPRLIMVGFHGVMAPSLAFSSIAGKHGRKLFAMLSPSRDGQLLAALFTRLGIGHVYATDGSRSVAGTREFVDRLNHGDIGYIALDGPRGPREVVKPGAVRLAALAQAHILAARPTASHAWQFGSWDRPLLPWPFARVTMTFRVFDPPREEDVEAVRAEVEAFLTNRSGNETESRPPSSCRADTGEGKDTASASA